MVAPFGVLNEPAFVPAMRQLDHGFAAVVDWTVEGHILDLAVAVEDFDAAELDIIAANDQLEPLELAVVPADVDLIVIVDETDVAVPDLTHSSA